MNSNFVKKETAICEYACDRYYIVDYNHDGYTLTTKGFLLNYYNGNVVLLAENGIYHLKYKDIVFMKPIQLPLGIFNKEYLELLNTLREYEE